MFRLSLLWHYNSFLASSGKDRSLCVFKVVKQVDKIFASPFFTVKKAHKRIIWDCSWFHNDHIATVSRDGTCKIWKINDSSNDANCVCIAEFTPFEKIPVTAVDVNFQIMDRVIMALGGEDGRLAIWEANFPTVDNQVSISFVAEADLSFGHGLSIKRLKWNPNSKNNDFLLASVGEDHTVRIYRFNYNC